MSITISVNGTDYPAKENETVLDVCLANGIDVPRLCDFPGLSDVGACRMCIVEITGERRPVPSCTYPVRDGLIVKTNTEQLEKYRRQNLELLFTERNHYCMFCEASGDCELQELAYRYQMDHVRYTYKFPEPDVDTLSEFLIVDHNRCILCGRCVRACDEVAASQTLGFSKRGWETKVTADLQQSLGNSSCRLCGACIQACPTGAITTRLSYYRGTVDTCTRVTTTCPGCSIGCQLSVLVRDNNIVRIEAPELTGSIYGSLCRIGRFELLETVPSRIMTPLIRNNRGILQEATYEEAVKAIVENISGKETAGIVSSRLPHETLDAFRDFIKTKPGGGIIDTTDGEIFRTISSCLNKDGNLFGDESTIADIPDGDYILIIGADPQMTNPVISTVIRRTVNKSKAKLAVINEEADVLPRWSYLWMNPVKGTEGQLIRGVIKTIVSKGWSEHEIDSSLARELESVDIDTVAQQCHVKRDDIEELARDYSQASKAVIIYGDKLLSSDTSAVSGIATLVSLAEGKSASMLLKIEANSRGAWDKGLAEGITGKPESFYLLLGDDMADEKLLKQIDGAGYLVVQASYPSPVTEKADVVIPSPIWSERSGSYTTIDGRNVTARSVVTPAITVKQDAEFLKSIMAESGMRIR